MRKFKYVSLFSGIGGFETALDRLGGSCELASEIDKYAEKAYQTIYGHATAGDIKKIAAADVPDHDILVGGFPCQAFSNNGRRKGFEDARGTLFFEIARIAEEKQPQLMLLENVKGLATHDKGRTLEVILRSLDDIGYDVDRRVMKSSFFGVPQARERVYLVCKRKDGSADFKFDFPAQENVTTKLADILEKDVHGYELSEKLVEQLVDRSVQTDGLAVLEAVKAGHSIAHVGDSVCFQFPGSTTRRGRIGKQTAQTLLTACSQAVVLPGNKLRKLTELESFRLQGFPDHYVPQLQAAGLSSTQIYKMAGNAVTVNVVESIGERLLPLLR